MSTIEEKIKDVYAKHGVDVRTIPTTDGNVVTVIEPKGTSSDAEAELSIRGFTVVAQDEAADARVVNYETSKGALRRGIASMRVYEANLVKLLAQSRAKITQAEAVMSELPADWPE